MYIGSLPIPLQGDRNNRPATLLNNLSRSVLHNQLTFNDLREIRTLDPAVGPALTASRCCIRRPILTNGSWLLSRPAVRFGGRQCPHEGRTALTIPSVWRFVAAPPTTTCHLCPERRHRCNIPRSRPCPTCTALAILGVSPTGPSRRLHSLNQVVSRIDLSNSERTPWPSSVRFVGRPQPSAARSATRTMSAHDVSSRICRRSVHR